MSKISDIHINPYNSPKGSLDICLMISDETGCWLDTGCTWGAPFYFKPESVEEYDATLDLCRTFELAVTYPTTQEQIDTARRILGG